MGACNGTKRDGAPCTVAVPPGVFFCYGHDRAEERRRSASRAATAKHSGVGVGSSGRSARAIAN